MAANQERDFVREAADLIVGARSAALAIVAGGLPHAALVTPALGSDGALLLLLSDLSAHTKILKANPACALLITGVATSENPQTAPRVMLGAQARVAERSSARQDYLRIHPYAELYADFADFNFFRVELMLAHYVGGFAAAAALDVAALQNEINARLRVNEG